VAHVWQGREVVALRIAIVVRGSSVCEEFARSPVFSIKTASMGAVSIESVFL